MPILRQAYFTSQTHAQTHMRRRGESNFCIKIFEIIGRGYMDEFGARCPELTLLTVLKNLGYLYTNIRFSSP
jgi:hypothetical protein